MVTVPDLKLEGKVLKDPLKVNGTGLSFKIDIAIHNVQVSPTFSAVMSGALGLEGRNHVVSELSGNKNFEFEIYNLDKEPVLKGRDLVRIHCLGKVLGDKVIGTPYLIEHLDENGMVTATYASNPRPR